MYFVHVLCWKIKLLLLLLFLLEYHLLLIELNGITRNNWQDYGAFCEFSPNTWHNDNVVITSTRHHFDVITSIWHRFHVITSSLLRGVCAGLIQQTSSHQNACYSKLCMLLNGRQPHDHHCNRIGKQFLEKAYAAGHEWGIITIVDLD